MRVLIIWTKLLQESDCALIPPFLLYHIFYPVLQSIMLRPPSPCSDPQLPHRRDLLADRFLHPTRFSCIKSTSFLHTSISNYAGSSSRTPLFWVLQELQADADAKAPRHAFALSPHQGHGEVDLYPDWIETTSSQLHVHSPQFRTPE